MQKLVWQNSIGDSVDLTSGNYGIKEWEGFSNASLNIQSQQVPFQDGAVFLNALMEQRELSVTLKMQDNNNLENRYRMRRELIHILNPKLGEGYLIYTNDYTSKRIKCIPQIPLFKTHNSNDSGTPEASLAWTACEPYWEDLEENIIFFNNYTRRVVKNDGDVPCQLKIDFITGGTVNPQIISINKNKKIKLNGVFHNNIRINTNIGEKSITVMDTEYNNLVLTGSLITGVTYSEQLGLFVAVGYKDIILTSSDGFKWNSQDNGIPINYNVNNLFLRDVIYVKELNLFIVIGEQTILTSSDGIEWDYQYMETFTGTSITYSERLGLLVAVGTNGNILTSSDGINWTSQTSGVDITIKQVIYSEQLSLFVAVGDNTTVLTSSDGIVWANQNIDVGTDKELNGVAYSKQLGLFVIVCYEDTKIYISSDGINWTYRYTTLNALGIIYSETLNAFISFGGVSYYKNGYISISYDGIHWTHTIINNMKAIEALTYSKQLGLFVAVGYEGSISTSLDCINWNFSVNNSNKNPNTEIINLAYSKQLGLFALCNDSDIQSSSDGTTWESHPTSLLPYNDALCNLFYSEENGLFIAVYVNRIEISSDLNNWAVGYSDSKMNFGKGGFVYSKDKDMSIIAIGNESGNKGYILKSSDCYNWGFVHNDNIANYDVTYSKQLGLFVAVCNSGKVRTSPNGVSWTIRETDTRNQLNSVTYSERLGIFVSVGRNGIIITSYDGSNWEIQTSGVSTELKKVIYQEGRGLFVAVGSRGVLLTSIDGVEWIKQKTNVLLDLTSIVYAKDEDISLIGGEHCSILKSKYSTNGENLINSLSSDSDINLNLDVGDNSILLSCDEGVLNTKLSFRQKYIGV